MLDLWITQKNKRRVFATEKLSIEEGESAENPLHKKFNLIVAKKEGANNLRKKVNLQPLENCYLRNSHTR